MSELSTQETGGGLFTYSIVVVDNDRLRSAEEVVKEFTVASSIPIRYCVEPQQNIAMARNRAVSNASGDFIAFIDDDEFPQGRWLVTLFQACQKCNWNRTWYSCFCCRHCSIRQRFSPPGGIFARICMPYRCLLSGLF